MNLIQQKNSLQQTKEKYFQSPFEQWVVVNNFPKYMISNKRNVYSFKRKRQTKKLTATAMKVLFCQ